MQVPAATRGHRMAAGGKISDGIPSVCIRERRLGPASTLAKHGEPRFAQRCRRRSGHDPATDAARTDVTDCRRSVTDLFRRCRLGQYDQDTGKDES